MKTTITAACCIIGDEILSGKTKDTNSNYLAKSLFDVGIELKRIEVVGDDKKDIADSVRSLSSQYDIVFTSGGIGKAISCPTHDDITYEAIAAAFNLTLKVDTMTHDYIQSQLSKMSPNNNSMTKHHIRMATFPHPAILLREKKELKIPIVVVNRNIHILPGVPRLFKILLDSLGPYLQKLSTSKFYRIDIATSQAEVAIADALTKAQANADGDFIKIGSYPLWGKNEDNVNVVVSVSGKNQERVQEIAAQVLKETKGWYYNNKSQL
ncbi:Molybdopterin binding protein [Backusella circina FSU 941]|nr:Molybdopterin binding protein [Backusella circina FSU 941]